MRKYGTYFDTCLWQKVSKYTNLFKYDPQSVGISLQYLQSATTPKKSTLTSRPSTVCVKLEPRPVWWVSELNRPRRLRPMICQNLPRSKVILV